jgi:hypothetical protein
MAAVIDAGHDRMSWWWLWLDCAGYHAAGAGVDCSTLNVIPHPESPTDPTPFG